MLTVYGHPISSFTWKALIALYENDTPFDFITVDQSTYADFIAKWPMGKFPILIDSDRKKMVTETSVIIEHGGKRPDPPALAHAAVRAAVAKARDLAPSLPLFAGGKSFGGRMTSQAQTKEPLPHVRGLVFFGFPLHPAGKPSDERATHLSDIRLPMLFLQGENDALASLDLLKPVVARLGERAALKLVPHADHSFHVPAKTGRTDADVLNEILDAAAAWMLGRD